MKWKFTRKTWYFCLLAASAATLLAGLAVLAGMDAAFLEVCGYLETFAFCMTALSALFLAAEKGSPSRRKGRYFGVFLLLMASYLFAGWVGYLASALAWPLLLATAEQEDGAGAVARPLRLVCGAEGLHLLFVLLAGYGGFEAARFWANLFWTLLAAVFAYSLPLLVGGLAGTANEFIDRQLIKYLVPEGSMAQLGVYGAITKIAVVMMLFYQMYRLAAEPFFLSNFKKSDFVAMNAAALKYYMMASMVIFLGIALFRDLFALIVGRDFREGIFILPVVLGANVLTGVWLNLSFWYKREERTSLAIVVTGSGLVAMTAFGFWLIPLWGYYGAAWARLASESVMVGASWWLNRRFFPTPYPWGRIWEYVLTALAVFGLCEGVTRLADNMFVGYAFNIVMFVGYALYLIRRERIDVGAMLRAVVKRG